MSEDYWKQQEMVENGQNILDIAGYAWKQLQLAVNSWCLFEMAGNDLKRFELAGNGWLHCGQNRIQRMRFDTTDFFIDSFICQQDKTFL